MKELMNTLTEFRQQKSNVIRLAPHLPENRLRAKRLLREMENFRFEHSNELDSETIQKILDWEMEIINGFPGID